MAKAKSGVLDKTARRTAHGAGDGGRATVAERLLLLALARDEGMPAAVPPMALELALAGAILLDLLLDRRIRVHRGRIDLIDWAPSGLAFLDRPLQKIHLASDPLTIGEWLALLAEEAGDLKHSLYERLAARGWVAVENRALASGFEARYFPRAKDGAKDADGRGLIGRIGRGEPLDPDDVLAVSLADAGGLFAAILSDKRRRKLESRIRHLADGNAVGEAVIEALAAARRAGGPDRRAGGRARDDKRPKGLDKFNNWEWRAFWSDRRPVVSPAGAAGLDGPVEFKESNVRDRYLLIPERRDNIKLRKNGLEVKELIESHRHYEAFRPKEVLKFPIPAGDLARIFPRLYGAEETVGDEDALEALLRARGYSPLVVEVEKVRNRVRLVDDVRLEFCEFTVAGARHWSACVEGPDFARVSACVQAINPQAGRVMGYMDFLHRVGVKR